MKASVLDINGKEKSKMDLPMVFSEKVREDIVFKVIEAKKRTQPYAPNPLAGNYAASGKMSHRRHTWQGHYGKGMSRIPRKVMSRRGTQFNWVGADIPGARGGRRAHPPKILSMLKEKKVNKKELRFAINSLISASEFIANLNSFLFTFFSLSIERIFGGCALLPPLAPGISAPTQLNWVPLLDITFLGILDIPFP